MNQLRDGILDLCWNSSKLAFYDFNLKTQSQNGILTAANFYPLWSGIYPTEVLNNSSNAFAHFASLNLVLRKYNGTFPASFVNSGQQWDAPNAWPPHQYIALQALRALPTNITNSSLPTSDSSFSLVPSGQLGIEESELPGQPIAVNSNSTSDASVQGSTVFNGGNATENEGWAQALQRELANRYFSSAFCSWYATGGSIEGILPRRSDDQLNVTQSVNNTGNVRSYLFSLQLSLKICHHDRCSRSSPS
jgi:alpha,alpha-trehalase